MKIENRQIEKFIGQYGAQAARKETYMGQEILLADGGPHYDPENDVAFKDSSAEELARMKKGYYCAIAFMPGRSHIGVRTVYCEKDHNPELTKAGKKEARLKAALASAKDEIATGIVNSLYV
jgi:hypothetical protein